MEFKTRYKGSCTPEVRRLGLRSGQRNSNNLVVLKFYKVQIQRNMDKKENLYKQKIYILIEHTWMTCKAVCIATVCGPKVNSHDSYVTIGIKVS